MKKISIALLIAIVLTLFALDGAVQAGTIPTISIMGVTADEKVTVKTQNYPANKDFTARMGLFGTKGVDGILVGTVNSGAGGSLKFTFEIPDALQDEEKIAIRLESTDSVYFSYNWFYNKTAGTHEGGIPADDVATTPSFSVASVKKDEYVVMKGSGFPIEESFEVLMGEEGTKAVDGILVDTFGFEEDDNGSFVKIFDIPESLESEEKIAIRIESKDSDLALYTWFKNETGDSGGSGSTDDDDDSYSGIPTISILAVKEDEEVTIKTHNFPAGKDFKVLMGKMGTKGVGGVEVTSFNSGDGGSFTKTFAIPDSLHGKYQIAIRLQTADNHFFAYNWFYNNTTGMTTPDGYTGIPTFKITAVEEDETVSIKTNNFPAGYDFKVLMGKMGTKGVGGIHVDTINSGDGGSFSATFEIPEALEGDYRIAIRLQATSGGFFAYNWFYNNTTVDENGDDAPNGYTGIPTFKITSVEEDETVTIKTNNFPAGYDFKVLMGKMGTKGVGGIHVETIDSGDGGTFTATFEIPEVLEGDYRIAIRLQATSGGFFAYNWFYNNTTP